jgi:hypothetical protein
MDDIVVSHTPDIKSLILTIRDTQVLLDSDVAMLYGYETRTINQTVSRNKDRFPERFRFKLTKEELDGINSLKFHFGTSNAANNETRILTSQNVTSKSEQRGGRRHIPYVFTD